MKTRDVLISTLLLPAILALPCSAVAQDSEQTEPKIPFNLETCRALFTPQGCCATPQMSQKVAEKADETRQGLPLAASEVAPTATTAVALTATDQDGRGVISFASNKQTPQGSTNSLALKVSAPFNQNQSVLASLAGLSGDIVASGSFSRFIWNISPQAYGDTLCQACQNAGITDLTECNETDLPRILQEKGLATESEIARRMNSLQDALFGRMPGTVLSFEASAGRKERTFFTPDGTKDKEDRSGYSFSALGGMILNGWSAYTRLTGKTDFKENDKATLCTPITDSILQNCTAQPLGEAKKVESLILATEARMFFRGFALAPSVQYDFDSEVWGFEAPLFLVRNADGGFTGGLKLAWRSDQEHLAAAVFVTRALAP